MTNREIKEDRIFKNIVEWRIWRLPLLIESAKRDTKNKWEYKQKKAVWREFKKLGFEIRRFDTAFSYLLDASIWTNNETMFASLRKQYEKEKKEMEF